MCGLLGWIVTNEHAESTAHAMSVALLARAMDGRGGHSHGVWTPADGVLKGLGDLLTSDVTPLIAVAQRNVVLAHTRYATTGARTAENAHPWEFTGAQRRIVGAHNGMVDNHATLNVQYGRTFAVDSQHLLQHIAEERDLSEIHAYGALTYADLTDGSLHIGRFNNGELAVWTLPGLGVYWCSTESALRAAMRATSLTRHGQVRNLKANRWYVVNVDGAHKDAPLKVGSHTWGHFNYYIGDDDPRVEQQGVTLSRTARPAPPVTASVRTNRDAVIEDDEMYVTEVESATDISDPFAWSADGQAAYNEYCQERGAEDDGAVLARAYHRAAKRRGR